MGNIKISENYFKTNQIETFIGFGKDGSSFDGNGNVVKEKGKHIINLCGNII